MLGEGLLDAIDVVKEKGFKSRPDVERLNVTLDGTGVTVDDPLSVDPVVMEMVVPAFVGLDGVGSAIDVV
jgi:hypothetical protein